MIAFKAGVQLFDLKPQTVLALILCRQVYDNHQQPSMTVTSINDGRHMQRSKHYEGAAFDLRTKGTGEGASLAHEIRGLLRPLGFDVLFEGEGSENEHIHVEWDPR